ncbi:hypothetical protein M408DRAFT_330099 [Serendipita vermifera MAFF 305830]|uniref:CFEM domain-containing protein n=1 Tax=Serendipita vermifera MAFF 305830 TaxID=933852 RepID=A0A0C2XE66_SERVB|nr:hypothetical protein M408DRAFT_330099 [Serendipita vermifera MAFF 305830]
MRIAISILLLFIASVFAQGDTLSDPQQCSDSCGVDAYATTSTLTACPNTLDLACICNRPDFESAFALCLRWTCHAVEDAAAQYHREQCAAATQGGGQSSPPASPSDSTPAQPPTGSATAPSPSTTTPLLSSIINALTSTGGGATTTRAGGSSSTTSRSGGVESISSQRAGMYAAIVASGVMMVFYINGY